MIKIYKYIIILLFSTSINLLFSNQISIDISRSQFNVIISNLESQIWNQTKIVEYNDSIFQEWLIKNQNIDQTIYINELVEWNKKLENKKDSLDELINQYEYLLSHQPHFIEEIVQPPTASSFSNQKELAQIYYNEGYYDDAILIYENLIEETIRILGYESIELVYFYNQLANLFLMINDLEKSKIYISKSMALQSSKILIQQSNFIHPLDVLNQIYKIEENLEGARSTDSLINILNSNISIINDTLLTLPSLLVNNEETHRMISEYSNNDLALDFINEAYIYLDNDLYIESAESFLKASNVNAEILDLNYYLNLDFSVYDKKIIEQLYFSFNEIVVLDSTKYYCFYYLGLLDYHNNNFLGAKNHFATYSLNVPHDVKGLQMQAVIDFKNENWFTAIFPLVKSLLIDPNNFDSNFYLSKTLIELGEYEDANKIVKLLLITKPYHIEANYLLGYTSYLLGNYNQAVKAFTNSLLQDPNNYLTYYYLAKTYQETDQNKKAKESLIKSINIEPRFSSSHMELAKIYEMIFEDELAITQYQLAKKYIGSEASYLDEINYSLGHLYYKNNNFNSAMNPLKDYIKNNLEDLETLEILGEVLIHEKRYPEAIDIYFSLLDLEYDNINYHFNIAEAYFLMNDYQNAFEKYEEIVLLGEKNEEVLLRLGTICNITSRFDSAIIYLLDSISCGSVTKETLVQLGIAYGGKSQYLQSMQAFKQALSYSLDDAILHYQLGLVYFELEIYDLASESFTFYLNEYNSDYLGYFYLGKSNFNLLKFDEAIKSFELSYKYKKDYIESIYFIGKSYHMINNLKLASQYYKLVIKQNPDHIKTRVELINLYSYLDKKRELKKECDIIYMLDRDYYNSIIHCNN